MAVPARTTPSLVEIRAERARRAEQVRLDATTSLFAFTRYTFPGAILVWYHRLLADLLDQVAEGALRRLVVVMPPRHGKSEMVSRRFPAYVLGRFPGTQIIAASYAANLASRTSRDVQRIIESPAYAKVFPRVRLPRRGAEIASRTSEAFELVDAETGEVYQWAYRAAGVGGGITGMGFTLGIIDDPLKDRAQADSRVFREKLWEWYTSTFYTRAAPGAAIIVVSTRWHHDDLVGRLLAEARDNPHADQWQVIRLPALSEAPPTEADLAGGLTPPPPEDPRTAPDQALWPERYATETLVKTRAVLGPYDWAALFQGRPSPREGRLFRRAAFRYFDTTEDLFRLHQPDGSAKMVAVRDCRTFATVDLAASTRETADYTVVAVWSLTPDHDLLLRAVTRDRLPGPDQLPAVRALCLRYGVGAIAVESNQYQLTFVQAAIRDGLPARAIPSESDKLARAIPASERMEAGTVYWLRGAPWLAEWEDELEQFDRGAHDDQVDTLSLAAKVLILWGGRDSTSGLAYTWRPPTPEPTPDTEAQARQVASDRAATELLATMRARGMYWPGE